MIGLHVHCGRQRTIVSRGLDVARRVTRDAPAARAVRAPGAAAPARCVLNIVRTYYSIQNTAVFM
jgi:hypothetical protein